MISLKDVTLQYRSGKGIFDIDFSVEKGSVTGYLGPNGAGKTTTIRALMGFMKPNSGNCTINGFDCYRDSAKIKEFLGYIPGEMSFPSGMNCREYLKYLCSLRKIKNLSRMNSLMERFELDAKGEIRKFSKGMKQKLGIITAFMHDPEVLVLDEPTSGLDPLMQNEFIRLIQEEQKRGKTILMSSHIFEEIERTCDKVMIIKEGKIVAGEDVKKLTSAKRISYWIKTPDIETVKQFGFEVGNVTTEGCTVSIKGEDTDHFIKKLGSITVTELDVHHQTLEDIFLDYYGAEEK